MNPQISYSSQAPGPRLKKPIKIALIGLIIIIVLVAAAALATLFVKPSSPELTDADTVSFVNISSLPSDFTQTKKGSMTLVNQKNDVDCSLAYGILPSTQYTGSTMNEYITQITTELRTKGWEVSDGVQAEAVSVASSKGDKTYKIPTQQINYTDGSFTNVANLSIQKLKNKKFLSITETCSATGNNDPAAFLSKMMPVLKLLKVDAAIAENK